MAANYLQKKLTKDPDPPLTKKDVQELIDAWRKMPLPPRLERESAADGLKAYLEFHGWPDFDAKEDAAKIVDVVADTIRSEARE
ncbi:hypothetical protein U8Q05_27000 (plasmid) [Rhizobium ruizarguesonis]|nr:hypothetical protein U8Q05_27000 [Rhizobium ruizarguesonis]